MEVVITMLDEYFTVNIHYLFTNYLLVPRLCGMLLHTVL